MLDSAISRELYGRIDQTTTAAFDCSCSGTENTYSRIICISDFSPSLQDLKSFLYIDSVRPNYESSLVMSNSVKRIIPEELKIDKEILDELLEISSTKFILQSLFNLSFYILLSLIALWIDTWWFWVIFWFFQGVFFSSFFCAAHDCAHGTFCKSKKINRAFGIFWSVPTLLNFSLYKHFHIKHHRHTGDTNDPESRFTFKNLWHYLEYLFIGSSYWFYMFEQIQPSFGRFPDYIQSQKAKRDVQTDNLWLLLWIISIIFLTFLWTKYTLLLYWIPLFTSPSGSPIALAEHYGCDEGTNILSNTRTVSSNFLVRYLCWNGNYHAEHHLYPSIPSYNLSRVNALIGEHFKYRESSYFFFQLKLIKSLFQQPDQS